MGRLASLSTDKVNFTYTVSNNITNEYYLHCHNFYEVYYFIDGDVDYLVEGRKYTPTPNSLLLLSPHVFHGVRINASKPYIRYSIHFHPDILSLERRAFLLSGFPVLEKSQQKNIYYEQVDRYRIPGYFETLADCSKKPQKFMEQFLPIAVEALLAQIVSISNDIEPSGSVIATSDTITNIIQYLNRHITDHITLEQLSEQFFISKHYLNKAFRKATGTTVLDYLIHKRVICAQQLLINGCSAGEAALKSGFGDYSVFYKAYMRILGHPPLKDRGMLPSLSASPIRRQEDITIR